MPSLIKVRVFEARSLPAMDISAGGSGLTDAYVHIRVAGVEAQTKVARRTLRPVWNEDFKFEVADDATLQNEPLEIRVMDHDTYSTDDLIGSVTLDMNLLLQGRDSPSVDGWFPLFDTLCGLRGELHVSVSLKAIGDLNPFAESSAGVMFFTVSALNPAIYRAEEVLGMVDELLVDADPEFEFLDNFRMTRQSNEIRLKKARDLFAAARRAVGRKCLSAGGNAVLGYRCELDLEGDSGIVVRAYGTAARISRVLATAFDPADKEDALHIGRRGTVVKRANLDMAAAAAPPGAGAR